MDNVSEIVEILSRRGLLDDEMALDEHVHSTANDLASEEVDKGGFENHEWQCEDIYETWSQKASQANNDGYEGQVRFLLECGWTRADFMALS